MAGLVGLTGVAGWVGQAGPRAVAACAIALDPYELPLLDSSLAAWLDGLAGWLPVCTSRWIHRKIIGNYKKINVFLRFLIIIN